MKGNELKILCLNGYRIDPNKYIDAIKANNENISSIDYNEYSKQMPSLMPSLCNTSNYTLMDKVEVKDFCQTLQKNLVEQNLNITGNTFFDLLFHGNIENDKHTILIAENVVCYTEDLIYHLNETFGARKFSIMSCHGGEASADLIESIYDISGNKFSEGISVSTYVEPQESAWVYLGEDSILHSLRNITKYFENNPTTELPAIVRFAQDLLHDHEMSAYSEITEHGYIQYKSSNLFTLENIEKWLNEYKESPDNFNFKSVIENYLTNEREKLIEAFKVGHLGNNSLEKTVNTLEALKNITLTCDEYQHFVLGRIVYRTSVTNEQEISEYKDLFKDFIKLLDNQGISFEADLNNTPEDGITPAESFFRGISGNTGKFNELLQNYLANKDLEGNTITHENDVHLDGAVDDQGLSDEIM